MCSECVKSASDITASPPIKAIYEQSINNQHQLTGRRWNGSLTGLEVAELKPSSFSSSSSRSASLPASASSRSSFSDPRLEFCPPDAPQLPVGCCCCCCCGCWADVRGTPSGLAMLLFSLLLELLLLSLFRSLGPPIFALKTKRINSYFQQFFDSTGTFSLNNSCFPTKLKSIEN